MHFVGGRRSVKDIRPHSAGIHPVAAGFPEQDLAYLGTNQPRLAHLSALRGK